MQQQTGKNSLKIHWDYLYNCENFEKGHNFKEFSFRMSNKKMADVMYAIISTHAMITCTYHLGYEYDRKQNGYNCCDAIIDIAPDLEPLFEEISGCQLVEKTKIQLN